MASSLKKISKKNLTKDMIDPNMRDYSNEPFFIKKAEDAKKVLTKYGLPKEFLNGKK